MNIYYVYAYISNRTGLPYYIGKGKDNRYKESHGKTPVPDDLNRIIFLERNLTNTGALALERRYIRWYGRRDNNTGILLNLTDGGEGCYAPCKETKTEMCKKGVETRRKNGSYKTGPEKAVITRRKRGNLGAGSVGGRKGYETRIKNGTYTPPSKESIAKAIAAKKANGKSPAHNLNTDPTIKEKSITSCKLLFERPSVKKLKTLAKTKNVKLGSGWVRKSDDWIESMISHLSQ